jgi:hypothetical protein
MFALTWLRLLIAFIVVLAFAATLAFAVFPSIASANHSWNGYHWARTDNPLALNVGDNLSGLWVRPFSYQDPNDNPAYDLTNADYLDTALSDWDQRDTSPVVRLTEVPGGTKPKKCRPTSGQVEVCNHGYGKTDWVGLTRIWTTSDGHITQATSKLNDTYLNNPRRFPQYSNPVWRQGTLCHELGHTLGLAHQDENSCMDNVSNPSSEDMRPNAHDYEQLEAIYESHTDNANTSSRVESEMPAALKDSDTTDPAQRDRQIRKSGWEEDPFVLQVKVVKEEEHQQQEQLQQQPQQSQPQHEQTQPQHEQTQPQHEQTQRQHEQTQPQRKQTQPQHEQPDR